MRSKWPFSRKQKNALDDRIGGVESFVGLGRFAVLPVCVIMHFLFILLAVAPTWLMSVPFGLPVTTGIVLAFPVYIMVARAYSRFWIRVVPLRANGTRRNGMIALSATSLIAAVFSCVNVPPPNFILVAPWAICAFLTSALLLLKYWKKRPDFNQSILFLRTFLGFSDRATHEVLFSYARTKLTVVSLSTTRSSSITWNPIPIAFSGNPLFSFSLSIPVFMRASNDEWQQDVRQLVRSCRAVVIDISDKTPGVVAEVEAICETRRPHEVLWLYEGTMVEAQKRLLDLGGADWAASGRIVTYGRSVSAALPGILGGFFVCFCVFLLLPLIRNPSLVLDSPYRPAQVGVVVGQILGMLMIPLTVFLAVFVRRAIDRRAQARIRDELDKLTDRKELMSQGRAPSFEGAFRLIYGIASVVAVIAGYV